MAARDASVAAALPKDPAEQRRRIEQQRPIDPAVDAHENAKRPSIFATALSYLTISRYGDMALRSFAYVERDAEVFNKGGGDEKAVQRYYRYGRWRCEALGALAAPTLGFPLLTMIVLRGQNADWQPLFRWLAAIWPRRSMLMPAWPGSVATGRSAEPSEG